MEQRNGYIWVPYIEWLDGDAVNPRGPIDLPAGYLVKHNMPGINPSTYAAAVEALNGVWYYHTFVAEGGWGWIGYNTVGWGPYIFEGAGIGNRGIHAPGANGISHGHGFLLDSSIRQPTQEEWSALRFFCDDLVTWGYMNSGLLIPNSFRNTNHNDWVATACPGGGVEATAHRFYEVVPSPVRRKAPSVKFQVRTLPDGTPQTWPGGTFGIPWPTKVYDAAVPAGYRVMVAPTQQQFRLFTVSAIINGQQQAAVETSESVPYAFDVLVDSFVTVAVAANVEPNISVG